MIVKQYSRSGSDRADGEASKSHEVKQWHDDDLERYVL